MMRWEIFPYQLDFNFDARTSRGKILKKPVVFVKLTDGLKTGWGECSTIKGLSVDGNVDYPEVIPKVLNKLSEFKINTIDDAQNFINVYIPFEYPSLRFALETAFLDFFSAKPFMVFENDFYSGTRSIKVNGLIWMGDFDFMREQIKNKVSRGFRCIKIKIGGIDFESELKLLGYIRSEYASEELTLRLDANGSFNENNCLNKLHKLSKYEIHSIEQPLPSSDPFLKEMILNSPIPIALDEELIGLNFTKSKDYIREVAPNHLIIKPSLLGGFENSSQWIQFAEDNNMGWWITSALESNIGLNAIAQFTSGFDVKIHQGLGTGMLYKNNIESPLTLTGELLKYKTDEPWDSRKRLL